VYKSLNSIWTLCHLSWPSTTLRIQEAPHLCVGVNRPSKKMLGDTNHQTLSNDTCKKKVVNEWTYANTNVKCINLKNVQHYGNWRIFLKQGWKPKQRLGFIEDCFKDVGLTLHGFPCEWRASYVTHSQSSLVLIPLGMRRKFINLNNLGTITWHSMWVDGLECVVL
jgi:hypothetical protein